MTQHDCHGKELCLDFGNVAGAVSTTISTLCSVMHKWTQPHPPDFHFFKELRKGSRTGTKKGHQTQHPNSHLTQFKLHRAPKNIDMCWLPIYSWSFSNKQHVHENQNTLFLLNNLC